MIWYYKALAECLLQQAEDCEQSARIASSLHDREGPVAELHRLAKIIRDNPSIKMVKTGNEI